MKKITVLATVALSCLVFYSFFSQKSDDSIKIMVCKAVEHEALNSVARGMEDYLMKQNRKYAVSVETCQGNMALASQIVSKFANSGAKVVVTIGTTPSQSAFKFAKEGKIKLVFSSVTNPNDISPSLAGTNTTGVSNFVALEPQLALFQEIQPGLKNLGVVYNTGEANSVSIVEKLKPVCEKMEINLIEQGISKISEIPQATEKLAQIVDAVFISNDNMALSAMPVIVSICGKKNVPVYVSDTDQIENGCTAALGPNQYEIGVQTGKMVHRIACGEDINKVRVEYPEKSELWLNLKGPVQISDAVQRRAKKIF
ncbi:MAG: ABC transporter substrate-binding protein [Holosporaceae bacterium]|jgi:putative ABC transport system substrate-binding protein|nr:ABC transporter substrate-binding protein [Holosporaceae bacterium]